MNSNPVFHPKFSVKNAFKDEATGLPMQQYRAQSGRPVRPSPKPNARGLPAQKFSKSTSIEGEKIQSKPVQRNRMDATNKHPRLKDRKHWKSKDAVYNNREVEGVRWQVEPYRPNTRIVPTKEDTSQTDRAYWKDHNRVTQGNQYEVETMTRKDYMRMGKREGNIQRQLRGRGAPQIQVADNEVKVVVPHRLGDNKSLRLKGRTIIDDSPLERNRDYWGGKTVVNAPSKPSRFSPKNE